MNPNTSPLSLAVFFEGAFIERVITSSPVQVASLDLDIAGTTSDNLIVVPAGLEGAGTRAILSVDQGRSQPDYAHALFLAMPQDDAPDPAAGATARRVLLMVKNGEVQSCLSDGEVRVLVLNRDTEGLDEKDVLLFPHENLLRKGTFDSEATWLTPTVDGPALEKVWSALISGAPQPTVPRRRVGF